MGDIFLWEGGGGCPLIGCLQKSIFKLTRKDSLLVNALKSGTYLLSNNEISIENLKQCKAMECIGTRRLALSTDCVALCYLCYVYYWWPAQMEIFPSGSLQYGSSYLRFVLVCDFTLSNSFFFSNM